MPDGIFYYPHRPVTDGDWMAVIATVKMNLDGIKKTIDRWNNPFVEIAESDEALIYWYFHIVAELWDSDRGKAMRLGIQCKPTIPKLLC